MRIPVITGPTAVGKTALSLLLAERWNGEIVSADSRQIYRELNIGTAKPSPDELARVPHHFINERSLQESFSAGTFASEAWQRISSVLERGHTPLVVGGSTLYLAALQEGIANIPAVPPEVRRGLRVRLELEGAETLHAELRDVDPATAQRLEPNRTQHLIRALEVYHASGVPLSEHLKSHIPPPFQFQTVVLQRDRTVLYERINARANAMLHAGLVDEVRDILETGYPPHLNALQTIGYREAIRYLNQEIDFEALRTELARNTRRYAKRQLTWFRRYPHYIWLPAQAPIDEIAEHLLGAHSTRQR